MVSQSSLPWALAKDSSRFYWPAVTFWLVLGPLAFLVSPLELDTSLAEPGGVTDAQRGAGLYYLSLRAGLLDVPGPLVLFPALRMGWASCFLTLIWLEN